MQSVSQLASFSEKCSPLVNEPSGFGSIERVYCISDLHTDSPANMKRLHELCSSNSNSKCKPGKNDALIVAGDISHGFDRLEKTLNMLTSELECIVFFVPGNHEAWLDTEMTCQNSLEKLQSVQSLCQSLPNVYTNHALLGKDHTNPVWICPIQSWYDGSLDLGPDFADLCTGFEHWPWVDFFRCKWPETSHYKNAMHKQMPSSELVKHFLQKNEHGIQEIIHSYLQQTNNNAGLITVSHFLPNQQTLPDWKDIRVPTFQRKEWLNHPVPDISAKFARVAGSKLIDEQIRSIHDELYSSSSYDNHLKHMHVFGHSHRPKDFTFNNIRYIHNPLGKPAERDMNMISPELTFQLLWDTKNGGEIQGEQVIRYWEEKGGGVKVLARKMKHSKIRKKVQLKRSLRELESNPILKKQQEQIETRKKDKK